MRVRHFLETATRHSIQSVAENIYLKTGCDLTRPLAIRGMINERCNYKCRYCNCWRMEEYQEEMTIAQWQAALLSLKEFIGSYFIQFAGGEPFIKKGFVELLEFCRTQGINWGVITNGSTFDRRTVERVVAAQPLKIDISVDSASSEIHDFARGVPGSLEKISQGIRFLREQKERQSLNFPIRIKPTVHKYNFRYLPELVEWSQQIGATSIDFAPVRPTYGVSEIETDLWLQEEIDIEDLRQIVDRLLAMKERGMPIETSAAKLRSFPDHFRGKPIYHGVSPCRVGLRDYHLLSNGDVRMCWFYPTIGNVKTDSAREIWFSDRARELRAQMVNCKKFGSVSCANSCLAHRNLGQKFALGWMLFYQGATSKN
ncbi:MAG: radical SAM protein [Cyanosarcina radialis HA8281-LM2]|jgi:MoaA/NifB/PqqE/SkfB family radical SAM enzyme|nr:radical SAM protein [Cyanosarcina radialis HA8281-LM2]